MEVKRARYTVKDKKGVAPVVSARGGVLRVRAPEEARVLARKAFELILCRYTGQLTEEQHEELARGLEALLPPPRRERKPFIPPAARRRAGEGAEGARATGQELKEELKGEKSVKIPVNPSLLPSLPPVLQRLALRGYAARVRVVRLGDLPPVKLLLALLPPRSALALRVRPVRLELEVSR